MFGYYRFAAAVPEMRVADTSFNTKEIIDQILEADKNKASVVVFPELSVCGYTCADLFHQSILVNSCYDAITRIAESTANTSILTFIGAPVYYQSGLYNCAVAIQSGRILGVVPKSYHPNYREFYDKRWFVSAKGLMNGTVRFGDIEVPFGVNLIFEYDRYLKVGVELCEDLWTVIPPSSYHALAGATVLVNLSASDELVAKADYRRTLVSQQSARCVSAYIYASSGVHESTTDVVYGGHALIAENGSLIAENERFKTESTILYGEVDCERLFYTRITETSFNDIPIDRTKYDTVRLEKLNDIESLTRYVDAHPFVPSNLDERCHRCNEIFSIQSAALAKRYRHTNVKKAVIGISGGLDSTLALLVVIEAFKQLGKDPKDIITVTMPGFGTTGRTYQNALRMCEELGTDLREINIKEACMIHFKDIGHDPDEHSTTYENVQARERTQLLMDIANKEGGLVIGTGDLSEIALGWSTYNGDHMSMYAVNCSVPKTLIRYLIQWVADHADETLKRTLEDVNDTPVSPELLPNDHDADINQVTEDIVGPYELHDFFLYHFVKYGVEPDKLKFLALRAFGDAYNEETVEKWLRMFIRRFFAMQFKRSCIPDGPKVGSISLSPRADWRMPSDAMNSVWQNW